MNANETKFQPVIEGVKQYVVPLFQRTYSWDSDEWKVLWDDLAELADSEVPRTHFIGSMVSMPARSVPEGVSKFLVIDGQQRLTTIFILLTLLRDKAKQKNQEELANEINDTFIVNRYKKNYDHFKLLPTQTDRESFQKMVLGEPGFLNSNTQISKAYQFFDRKLRQNTIDLQKLQNIISNNLSVVSIVLDPEDNPHLVFESLNAKGRPLTQADLIRNFFFMKIHIDDQKRVYQTYWKPMQDALGDQLTVFIRHYLMRNGTFIKQNDIYFALKDSIIDGDAISYLKQITRYAVYYHKLINPSIEKNKSIRVAIIRLNRLEATTVYPFLLNCYDDFDNKRLSEQHFVDTIKVIENFLIRRFVCNVPTNQLNKVFPPLYAQIIKMSIGFIDGLKKVLQTKSYPKNGEFSTRLKDAKLYGSGDRARKTKLILESIEESYNHKEMVPFENLSIEHVMPQTLTPYWQEHLGNDWEMLHELYLHTLGNLTLTAYNTEMSNETFEIKKQSYSASHLDMNKYLSKKATWHKEDIEERAKVLANKCLEIWPFFGDETNEAEITGTTPRMLWILGQHFDVRSWRDVMEETMNTISELEPEKFEVIVGKYSRFVGYDQSKFRAIRQLKNKAYIEVNLSAKAIQHFCIQALETIELTSNDFIVETV